MRIRFAGLDRSAASLERALDGLLAALTARGHELWSFPYPDKVRILHACWPTAAAEADCICETLMRFWVLREGLTKEREREDMERDLLLLQQAFRTIRIVGADPDEGFRTIAVQLCGLLDNAADKLCRGQRTTDPEETRR